MLILTESGKSPFQGYALRLDDEGGSFTLYKDGDGPIAEFPIDNTDARVIASRLAVIERE